MAFTCDPSGRRGAIEIIRGTQGYRKAGASYPGKVWRVITGFHGFSPSAFLKRIEQERSSVPIQQPSSQPVAECSQERRSVLASSADRHASQRRSNGPRGSVIG